MRGNTRKIIAAIIMLVMTATLVVGCGKKATPENLFKDMGKNLEKTKSVSSNMKIEASLSDGTSTIGLSMDMDMDSTKKPEAAYGKGKVKMMVGGSDIGMDMELYQVEENDETITYMNAVDQWTRSEVDEEESMTDPEFVEDFSDMADAFRLSEELSKVNDKECFELVGKIKGEDLKEAIDGDMLDGLGLGEALDTKKLKDVQIPCTIDVYKDEILPARIYIDLKDVVAKLTGDSESGALAENYYVEMTYMEYNKVKEIMVPDEVKSSAVEEDLS